MVHVSAAQPSTSTQHHVKLVGRKQIIGQILDAWNRVGRGRGEVLLVPGPSGIGKTAAVESLRELVQCQNGLFLDGKFNQFQRNVPFAALRQALGAFCNDVAAEPDGQRNQWLAVIESAVGELGQLLIDLAPGFQALLGDQPAISNLNAIETRLRLSKLLGNFLGQISRPEHPVVLFLDDWQWADSASLEFLTQLRLDYDLSYLLLIVAYRDNEVDDNHPLRATLTTLQNDRKRVTTVALNHLNQEQIRTVISQILGVSEDLVPGSLVDTVLSATAGNPLHVHQLIGYLQDAQSISSHSGQICFAECQENLPANLVALFTRQLQKLPEDEQQLLALAACLGHRFDVESLSLITSQPVASVRTKLEQLNAYVWQCDQGGMGEDNDALRFQFHHDKVQQAAYGLIPADKHAALRLSLARRLLAGLSSRQIEEQLFEVAEHFQAGLEGLTDPAEFMAVLQLLVKAGKRARDAAAYRVAIQFYRSASELFNRLEPHAQLWKQQPQLASSLCIDRAEMEFLQGAHAVAEGLIRTVAKRAPTPLLQAEALAALIVQFTLRSQYAEAINTGREALKTLGVVLPEDDFASHRDAELNQVRRVFASKSLQEWMELPLMSDPVVSTICRLLITLGPPCYRSHPELWSVIVPKVVGLTLQHGHLPQIGYSHPALGGLLSWVSNDMQLSREFGRLVDEVMRRHFHAPSDESIFYLMRGSSWRHWFEPLSASIDDFDKAYQVGLESGNLQYAAYAFGHKMFCMFCQGVSLPQLVEESSRSLDFAKQRHNRWAIDLLQGGLRVVESLERVEALDVSDAVPQGELWHNRYEQQIVEHGNHQVLCYYRIMRLVQQLLAGDLQTALATADSVEPLLETVGAQGLLPWPTYRFCRAMVLAGLYDSASREQQAKWLEELLQIRKQIGLWGEFGPGNFRHKEQVLAAEIARLQSNHAEAARLFDAAIAEAEQQGFIQWQALALERSASMWFGLNEQRIAQQYWQQAYSCYRAWGAKAKVAAMEREFIQQLGMVIQHNHSLGESLSTAARQHWIERQLCLVRRAGRLQAGGSVHQDRTTELTRATKLLRADVAERRKVELALLKQRDLLQRSVAERTAQLETSLMHEAQLNERFELAAQAANLGVWDWSIQSNELLWDGRMQKLNGFEPTQGKLQLQDWLATIHDDDRIKFQRELKWALREGDRFSVQTRVCWPCGAVHTLRIWGKVVRDTNNKPLRLTGVSTDVTDEVRKKMLLNLRREISERVAKRQGLDSVLRRLVEATEEQHQQLACAVVLKNHHGNGWTKTFGPRCSINFATMLESGLNDQTRHRLQHASLHKNTLENGNIEKNSEPGLLPWLSGNGDGLRAGWCVPIRMASGEIAGALVGCFRDRQSPTTDERELFHALSDVAAIAVEHAQYILQLEDAKEAALTSSRTKSDFLANMSHEIRTPMTAILGFTDLIRDELGANILAKEAIETIQRNGRHLLEIIDGILDLSKIEADRVDLEHLPCSPTQLIGDIMALLRIRATAKGIQLGTHYLGQIPSVIYTDPTRLKQVLLNLVGNAIKFTDHGSVRIRVQVTQLDGNRRGLRIDVIDTGIGMNAKQLGRLFEPFSQADSSMTRRFGGTGLGLTISRRLANLLGGTLEVTSEPRVGSCFSLSVPIGEGESVELARADKSACPLRPAMLQPAANTLQGRHILLAEDGPDNQRLISFVLQKAGANVTVVDNGLKVIEQLIGGDGAATEEPAATQASQSTHDVDVVLLDMQMPVLDGYSTASRLRSCGFQRPIIALTAHAMEGEREKCLQAGCDEFATKPIDRNTLIQLIAQLTTASSDSVCEPCQR